MTRSPLVQQRKRRMVVAMTAAIGTFNIISYMARWFLLGCLIINHMIESKTLRKKYRMNFDNRRAKMERMVYQSDIASVVTIRMDRETFSKLCKLLKTRGGLRNSKHMLVDEQVAMFLHTLAHNQKNRIIVNRFQRSGETISRYFKLVLDAICRLHKEFYKTPVPIPDDETDERWKWFKGCLGALDGTYIKVRVPTVDRKPYRTRKGEICTNVLGVCTRDLMFTYVLAGWEGSAVDSRVLRDAISRPHGLRITQGTYYLCDVGYTNGDGFLTPYRGQRYHLNDWSNPRTTAKKLYNKKHSSARNVIERCFGLIKARWGILRGASYHPVESMPRIIIACCLMHNFIRTNMNEDFIDNQVPTNHTQDGYEHDDVISTVETSQLWSDSRDNLATNMFNEWINRHNN